MDGTVPTFFESCSPHTGDWPPGSPNQCAFVISPLRVDRAHRPHNETSGEALPMCYGVLAERATLTVEELTHIAEFLISRIQQVFYRLVRQHYQLAVQDGIQQPDYEAAARLLDTDSGTISSMMPSSFKSVAVILSATAAVSALAESRHIIPAQPSGEITE